MSAAAAASRAARRDFCASFMNWGTAIEDRTPMIPTTTINSMSVNPVRPLPCIFMKASRREAGVDARRPGPQYDRIA